MRQGYIEIIKEYIRIKSKGEYTLEELKQNAIKAGATNEEFDEAVRHVVEARKESKTKFYKSRKLILSLPLILILFFGFLVFTNSTSEPLIVSNPINPAPLKTKNQGPITQVYANFKEIDPQKAFIPQESDIPLVVTSKPKKEVLGFFPYWMLTKAQDIDLNVLTSISIFGLETDGKGEVVTINSKNNEPDPGWQMWKDPKLDALIKDAKNSGLKIFLTLKSFDNENIEDLVSSADTQKNFISNALYLFSSKNLDGINLDFEYTGEPPDATKRGFTRLVTNLDSELERQFPNSILTIDTYIISGSIPGLFELSLLSKHVDAFVVMGYDIHTALGDPGPVSPMGGNINIIELVQKYLEQVPEEKIILAVPYYGYDWPGEENADILPYSAIIQNSINHKLLWDDTSQTPWYTYSENGVEREVHFENVRSLGIKYDYVINKNLKGIGIWALGYDGYRSDLQRLIIDKFSNQ